MKPKRFRLSRKKGYRKPEGVISVVRPGRWGNPFDTAAKFEEVLTYVQKKPYATLIELNQDIPWTANAYCTHDDLHKMKRIVRDIGELACKDLACYCFIGAPCHADVLIKFANR